MPAEKQAAPPQTPAVPEEFARLGEIIIEVGDRRNRQIPWPVTNVILRGHWLRHNLPGEQMHSTLQLMPDWPGMRIALDCRTRTGRIFDPLEADPDLVKRINKVYKEFFSVEGTPDKPAITPNLNHSAMKEWLYWMARLVNGRKARMISGELPRMEEIMRLPGKVRSQPWHRVRHILEHKFREDRPEFQLSA